MNGSIQVPLKSFGMTVLIQGTSLVLMPWDLMGGTLVFIVILACQENFHATTQRRNVRTKRLICVGLYSQMWLDMNWFLVRCAVASLREIGFFTLSKVYGSRLLLA